MSTSLNAIFEDVVKNFNLQSVDDEKPDKRRDDLKTEVKEFLKEADERYNGLIAKEFAHALKPSQDLESD